MKYSSGWSINMIELFEWQEKQYAVYEGLIKTESIKDTLGSLKRKWPSLYTAQQHTMRGISNDFTIKIDLKKVNDFEGISQMLNSLGWFISTVDFYKNKQLINKLKNNISIQRINNLVSEANVVVLFVEAKFDVKINKDNFPKVLYHVTPKKFEKNIREIGLVPKTQSKDTEHPPRIYLSFNKADAVSYLKKDLQRSAIRNGERFKDEFKDWILVTIDPNDILKLFRDPNYEFGLYTLSNIKPYMITKIEDI